MKTLVLAAACLALLALLASGCIEGSESGKYFEIVLQDDSCSQGACFDEWLALEDGLLMHKQSLDGINYEISFCQSSQQEFQKMLSEISQGLKESRIEECESCAKIHLFYNDGKATRYSSVKASSAFEKSIFERSKKLCAAPASAELIHVISGKNNSFSDYHIFSNNAVVFEKFGLRDGELLDSKVSSLKAGEFEELKKQVPAEFFETETFDNCPANGLFYGFIEARLESNYSNAFTCGDSTPKGTAFQKISGRFS